MLVVHEHNRSDTQSGAAFAARRHFALHILQKPIGEVIFVPVAARGLETVLAASRAVEFDTVFLRVAIKRGPSGIADANSFFRMTARDKTSENFMEDVQFG